MLSLGVQQVSRGITYHKELLFVVQGKGDSGLQFAERSHRDIAIHAQGEGCSRDLSDRGYRIKSVGEQTSHSEPDCTQAPLHGALQIIHPSMECRHFAVCRCLGRREACSLSAMLGACEVEAGWIPTCHQRVRILQCAQGGWRWGM